MEQSYKKAFGELNKAQRQAVTTIDGPLLVVAGPGTGKTQLLSTRVGYILQSTDTVAESIICLTFTESGALAMRQRLTSLIGEAAYDVQISTYHAFGSELIRRYPEYVSSAGLEPVDDVGMNSLIREILDELPYSNPYKWSELYTSDLLGFISDAKRALLSPDILKEINKTNMQFGQAADKLITPLFKDFNKISKNSLPLFEGLLTRLEQLPVQEPIHRGIEPLSSQCRRELSEALMSAAETGKTNPITKWKNKWLARDNDANMILAGQRLNNRLEASTEVYSRYLKKLAGRNLFDYDDMILRAIKAMESNPDFKLTLAERYQYIMLDEFQDTNPSQLRLIELLTDSPVNEGRPNVMAVGDDDQAIYAFQGANYSNLLNFLELYRDVTTITLTDNYRSHADILEVAYGLSESIETRLSDQLKAGSQKILNAAAEKLPAKAVIARHEFITEPDENAWVAAKIAGLIKGGLAADQIAVLAPKHKYLQSLLPFLAARQIPVWYEKREDVLDEPHIRMLEQMARLALALEAQDYALSSSLWAEVLSYEFWNIPIGDIWQLSWEAHKSLEPWTNLLIKNKKFEPAILYFLDLVSKLNITTLEQQLDALVGVDNENELLPASPFYDFYFRDKDPAGYLTLLGNLTVLRDRLRRYKREVEQPLGLVDFIAFIDAHRLAKLPIINTSPYHANDRAVQLMTTYKAKGLEFEAVFIITATDEVWGSGSRTRTSRVSLPFNLTPIRYGGADDDERRRLLYVAATRAKTQLILTSYAQNFDGKPTNRLKYLESGKIEVTPQSASQGSQTQTNLELYWGQRHFPPLKPSLRSLLEPKLARYQLSATHLNNFIDITNHGPRQFFINTVLRFPKAPRISGQFGNAIHETLEWAHGVVAQGRVPATEEVIARFEFYQKAKRLSLPDTELLLERGRQALAVYWPKQVGSFTASDVHEYNFWNEGVLIDKAHLAGKIDKLVIDKKSKTITVVDFKTGTSHAKWSKSISLHKYRQQLLVYKLLVENSHTYRGYTVNKGILEFVEPDDNGRIVQLELAYKDDEVERIKQLITSVWKHVMRLDFPDTGSYSPDLAGILAFEQDLIAGQLKS